MEDVARRVGVSRATASYALRGDARIRPRTRQRVLEAAEELGYRLNRAAAILGSREFRRSGQIEGCGIALLYEAGSSGMVDGTARWEFEQASEYASSLGHQLEAFPVPSPESLRQIGQMLHARGFEALILSRFIGNGGADLDLSDLGLDRFALVSTVHRFRKHRCDVVRPHFYGVVREAFERLLSRGCRRVGAMLPFHDPILPDDRERRAACLECLEHHVRSEDRIPPLHYPIGEKPRVGAWFRENRPDGVLGFNPFHLKPAREQIGEDFDKCEVICLNAPPRGWDGRHDAYCENRSEVYRQAVNLLDQLLRLRRRGVPETPVQILVPPMYHPKRES